MIPVADLDVLRRWNMTAKISHVQLPHVPRFRHSAVLPVEAVVTPFDQKHVETFCFCLRDVRARGSRAGHYDCNRVQVERADPAAIAADPDLAPIEIPHPWTDSVPGEGGRGPDGRWLRAAKIACLPNRDQISEEIADYVLAWAHARAETDHARQVVLSPLNAEIARASTLQSLAKIWPQAMALAERFSAVRISDDPEAVDVISQATFADPPPSPVVPEPADL